MYTEFSFTFERIIVLTSITNYYYMKEYLMWMESHEILVLIC